MLIVDTVIFYHMIKALILYLLEIVPVDSQLCSSLKIALARRKLLSKDKVSFMSVAYGYQMDDAEGTLVSV